MKTTTAAFLLVLGASVAHGQTVDARGHWKGTIDIPNNPREFDVDLATTADGELTGTATAADHVTVPLLKATMHGRKIVFFVRTDQPFDGELAPSAGIIAGTVTLNGYALPFSMSRTGEPRIDPPPTSRAVSRALEGVWNGTLAAGDRTLRLVVTVRNQPDGTALAQSVSVDEGGLMLPLVVVEDGANVTFQSRGVPITFAGILNAAGTQLTGTFTQGATNIPLSLTR